MSLRKAIGRLELSGRNEIQQIVDDGLDDVFNLLSVSRRRQLILILADQAGQDGGLRLSDAAERVALSETGYESVDELPSQHRKRVYVSLYQNHVPILEEAGILTTGDGTDPLYPTAKTHDYARIIQRNKTMVGEE
jgi:hypothetical protein